MGNFAPGREESFARGRFKPKRRRRCSAPECSRWIPAGYGTQRPADYCAVKCRDRAQYLRHREDRIAKQAARNAKNHDARLAWQLAHYHANKDAINARRRVASLQRLAGWLYLHPRCMICSKPVRRYGVYTCGDRRCATLRWRWFVREDSCARTQVAA